MEKRHAEGASARRSSRPLTAIAIASALGALALPSAAMAQGAGAAQPTGIPAAAGQAAPGASLSEAVNAARAATERRDWDSALPRWRAIEVAAPSNVDLLIESARVHGFADRNAEAAERYRRALELAPQRRGDLLLSLAWQTLWSGRPGEAEPMFVEIADRPAAFAGGGDGFDAWRGAAEARRNAGRLEASLQALEQARALRPDDRGNRRAIAQTLAWLDRHEQAIAAYERLLAEDAGDRASRYGLAQARNFAGRHRAAAADYRDAMAADRQAGLQPPADALFDHARALRWAGYDDHAHRALTGLEQADARWLGAYRTGRELRNWADAGVEFATDRDKLDTRVTTAAFGWRPTSSSSLELGTRLVDLTEPTRAAQGERLGLSWRTRIAAPLEAIGSASDRGPAWLGLSVQANRYGSWHPVTGGARGLWLARDDLRVEGELGREVIETPLAVANRVTVDIAALGAQWRWQPRSSVAATVAALKFDDGNLRTRLNLRADHIVHSRPKVVLGVEAMAFRSSDPTSETRPGLGYWNPRSYQEARAYVALGHEARPWDFTLKLGLGTAREQDGWGNRSSGNPNLWELSAGYELDRSVRLRAYAGGSGGTMGVASGGEGYWRRYVGLGLTAWF